MAEPQVIGQTLQPITGSPEEAPALPHVAQRITFKGELAGEPPQSFSVLANEAAPTPTEGWPIWARVKRPQRVSMTVLEGYEPMTMTVPILFDAVVKGGDREDVELNIQKLEWMAGRGILFQGRGGVGAPGQGDSPLVQVFTVDSTGRATQLVPKQYQTAQLRWVVTNIEYDPNPLRDLGNARIRQAATVTLTEHVGSPGTSLDSSTARAKARAALSKRAPVTFRTTAAIDTIQKVASFYVENPSSVNEILRANRDNRKIGSNAEKPLRLGTKVKVPLTAFEV